MPPQKLFVRRLPEKKEKTEYNDGLTVFAYKISGCIPHHDALRRNVNRMRTAHGARGGYANPLYGGVFPVDNAVDAGRGVLRLAKKMEATRR